MSCVLKTMPSLSTRSIVALVSRIVANFGGGHQKWYSSKDGSITSGSPFSNSVILLQDGLNIEELPIAVRKATNTFLHLTQRPSPLSKPSSNTVIPEELDIFKQCTSLESIFMKLGELKTEEVSADVSLRALEKIAQSGQNLEFRNQGCTQQLSKDSEVQNESFTADAVVLQLGTIIIQQGSINQLICALKIITLPSFPGRIESLRKLLAEECLNKILDGKCNISQICQAVRIFSTSIPQQGWADKCWVGLIGHDLSTENIVEIYKILPYLKESQRAIYNHIEKCLPDALHELSVESVLQILAVVNAIRLPNRRINPQIAYWLSLNLHKVDEEAMKKFLVLFLQLDYYDPLIVGTVERFLKVKSGGQEFLSAVANYCSRFRVVVPTILNAVAERFVSIGRDLNVTSIEAVVTTFGLLGYQPQKPFEFWMTVETVLDEKLVQFRPESLLDVLLSCIYLERYPINFIPRLFSPHFLHRLSNQEPELTERCRQKIKLLDASMCLESSLYGTTHVLRKDHHLKVLRRDGRIIKASTQLVDPLQAFYRTRMMSIHPGVILCHLPLHDIYIVDLLITASKVFPHYRYGKGRELQNRGAVAVLIHSPEHYVRDSKRLNGIQMMRDRQMKLLGFHVAHLDLEDVFTVLGNKELWNPYFECHLSPHLIHI